ncbi:MAG: DoxX family membrane protein [Myxococcota bacterium]
MPDDRPTGTRSPVLLRLALGIVYLHFGILKFFPDLSPAEMIASQTVIRLSWSWLDARTAMWALALGECCIGLAFLFNVAPRWLPFVFLLHMIGTCSPLFILPELTFKIAPFAPTLEGQYILKNLVFLAAGWTVLMPRGSVVPWGRRPKPARNALRPEPTRTRNAA